MPTNDIHYFGIRHHGPGSSKRLLAALQNLQPARILIEGPQDCSELLPMLASKQMKPPVALLAYSSEQSACSIFYPFADYSPEYQACCWAVKANIETAFIDVPVAVQLSKMLSETEHQAEDADELDDSNENSAAADEDSDKEDDDLATIVQDPIGSLARLSGYEDGEAWWNDLIEQNSDSDEAIFDIIESAMQALRDNTETDHPALQRDRVREAFMRLEIAKAKKVTEGPLAIVCGAWHVPGLREKHTAKNDRALIKTLPSKLPASKVKATWVPWTSPRLATASGYGAGVAAPMWYQHLWEYRDKQSTLEYWLGQIAQGLRDNGQLISTASVIEAVRLSNSLAAIRNRPEPAFEEIREAVIACLCFGEPQVWRQIETHILLGNQVGQIPPDAPLVPLLEDLQRLQKKNKLKPEALDTELSLDLRTTAGLSKSILLHRLNILDVPWGRITDAGKSRGTFRERWHLSWQPEYAVRLVENLVYGSTIEQAASTKISEALENENNLSKLASSVQLCLEAQLNQAADIGLLRIQKRAAHTSDCLELLESLAPLINVNRYGTAREISLAHIEELIIRLTIQTAIALPYACRNLDDEEAHHYRKSLSDAHQALQLVDFDESVMEDWWQAIQQIVDSPQSDLQLAGLCARLLYQAEKIPSSQLEYLLQRMLSPALPAADAARFFDGFFTDAIQRLLYDRILLDAIEHWLISLDEDSFTEYLPLFRRIFSDLDTMERKRMIDTVLHGRTQSAVNKIVNPITLPLWPDHLQRIAKLLKRDKDWSQ